MFRASLRSEIGKSVANFVKLFIKLIDHNASERPAEMSCLQAVDAATLNDVEDYQKQETVIAVAVFYGTVRLIDNIHI